jgi:thiamine biosynthesis lipoprotein
MMYKTVTIALIAILSVSFVINCIDKGMDSQEPIPQIYNDTRSITDTIVTIKVVDTNSSLAREAIDNVLRGCTMLIQAWTISITPVN